MSATTTAPASATMARPSPKQQFAQTYAKEHATTLKVLRAFPADRADYKPHERSNSALQLAWTFVIENNLASAALRGPLQLEGKFPPAPPSLADVIAAYEASARELLAILEQTPESRLAETVSFFTGPGQMGEIPVGEILWFTLMDSVHHRGQLSVYVRCAGGKVPSIYGPSADEPWM
jgi:uncharacterized damage-inducible protein DinB